MTAGGDSSAKCDPVIGVVSACQPRGKPHLCFATPSFRTAVVTLSLFATRLTVLR